MNEVAHLLEAYVSLRSGPLYQHERYQMQSNKYHSPEPFVRPLSDLWKEGSLLRYEQQCASAGSHGFLMQGDLSSLQQVRSAQVEASATVDFRPAPEERVPENTMSVGLCVVCCWRIDRGASLEETGIYQSQRAGERRQAL
jgi:hypothetical protein